jgi:hypothetical protein
MMLNRTMVVCALALAVLAVGCGDKCKSVCDEQKKCSDTVAGLPDGMTCDKLCDDVNGVSDASKCDKQRDDYYDCADKVEDKCDASSRNTCDTQQSTWSDCIGTYCQAHPSDKDCKKFFDDFGIAYGGA